MTVPHAIDQNKLRLFLDRKKVCVLSDWLSRSNPNHLDPIENLWVILKKNFNRRNASNKEDLWHVIAVEWNKISNDYIL